MHEATASLAAAIGARVRQQRRDRHWTLDQLAAAAGLSRRAVVNVEQGNANPGIGTLLRISDALGVGLPALVEPPRQEPVTVVRDGEAPTLWTGAGGGTAVLVAGTEPPDVVELWDWSLGPGDAHHSEPHAAGTTELLQVLEGTLDLRVGEQVERLSAGDAARFCGDVEHAYAQAGDRPTRFSLAVFEPGVGSGHA